jgi:7,8-dihydropterin-6-yl-methyl-4-(beta-D-ribofuranosyl)aminobenzene 5'-phosphate synthase
MTELADTTAKMAAVSAQGGAVMKIVMLMENTVYAPEFACEHGLSMYIETGARKILFDMGASEQFAANAKKLGVDLSQVDTAILSHGHNDHGGGLATFLALNKQAPVYLQKLAFEKHGAADGRDISLDAELITNPRLHFVEAEMDLRDSLHLYNCNAKVCPYPVHSYGLTKVTHGRQVPDDFQHEQYLLVEENGRRVLFSGCSHKGILNLMSWFKPDVLVGGFHFMKLDPATADRTRLETAAKILAGYQCQYYTCHCTGQAQFTFLHHYLGDQLHYAAAGQIINL